MTVHRLMIFALLAVVLTAAARAQAPAAETAEFKRGRLLYIQCRACHELKPAPGHKVGPNLAGFIGRKAATVPGFSFSSALKTSGLTWDRATLDRWLEKPSAVVPGNTMAFAGIASPKDRAALIAYLEAESRLPR
jgi:cytochrome c